jgi:Asp/Glu/hydantoin racemase
MATLQEIYDVRYSSSALRSRVIGAILVSANDIINNAVNETEKRLKWARAAMKNPEGKVDGFLLACALNPTVAAAGASATDNDLLFVVQSTIDALNDEN